jgi:hypothetical protein
LSRAANFTYSLAKPNPVANQDWTLFVHVHNTGAVAFAPRGFLTIKADPSGRSVQQTLLTYPIRIPGRSFDGRVDLAALPRGNYTLAVTLLAPGRRSDYQARFSTRAHQPLGTWIVNHLPFLLAGIAGVIAFLFARRAIPRSRPPVDAARAESAPAADPADRQS